MSLGDSLTPDRTQALAQDGATQVPSAWAQTPTEVLFARTDAAVDAEFGRVFGAGGPEARAALARTATVEGPAAYDRFGAHPEAFGAVTGERSRADALSGAARALAYSKAIHSAEQTGQPPIVPGYGTPVQPHGTSGGGMEPRGTAAGDAPAGGGAAGEQGSREPVQPRTPEQVQDALGTIRWCLTEGRVTRDDLRTADRALWGLTEPGDASRVVGALNEEGLLGEWMEELNDNFYGPLRGFDTDERQAFYDRLADRLDGEALAHVATAIEASAGMARPGEEGERFGQAVATYASPEARAQFVERVLPRVSAQLSGGEEGGVLARATAEAIGGLAGHGEWLRDPVATLASQGRALRVQSGQTDGSPVHTPLERLLAAGVVARTSTEGDLLGAQQITTFDSGPAVRMLRALATVDDPSVRAQAFMDASEVAAQLHLDDSGSGGRFDTGTRGGAERDLRSAQGALLLSRPNETLTALMVQGDRPGRALTAYVQDLVRRGDSATITRDIRSIQHGDEQNQDARTRFTTAEQDPGGNMAYSNAARLGYYVGAVAAAFQGIADRDRDAAQTLADIVGAVVRVPGVGPLATEAGDAAADARVETLQQQLSRLTSGMIPTVARLNERGETERVQVNGPEVDAYDGALERVLRPNNILR